MHRRPAREIGQRVQADDLVCELLDRARAVGEVPAGVRRTPGDAEPEAPEALARRLQISGGVGRLDDERRGRARGCVLEQRPRRRRADLLVGRHEDAQRARRSGSPDRLEQDDEARLHVEGAWAVRAAVLDAPRKARERPAGPHRVEMPEQQQRRALALELRAQMLALPLEPRAEPAQLRLDPVAHRARVAGRRLDLDELPEQLHRVHHV